MAATGRRDVELVVSAKDEATKALGDIESAYEALGKAQSAFAQDSEKSNSVLARMGKELKGLTDAMGGVATIDRFATATSRVVTRVEALEKSLADSNAEIERNDVKLKQYSQTLLDNETAIAKATAAEREQSAVLKRSKQELTGVAAEIRKLTASETRAGVEREKTTNKLTKAQAGLRKYQESFRELSNAVNAAADPSASLIQQFTRAEAKMLTQANAVRKLESEIASLGVQQDRYSSGLQSALVRQTQLAESYVRSQASLTAMRGELSQLSQSYTANSQGVATLNKAQNALANNVERTGKALDAANVDLIEVAGAADKGEAAIRRLGNTLKAQLSRDLRSAQGEMRNLERTWTDATAKIAANAKLPIADRMSTGQFDELVNSARRAKTEFELYREAILRFRQGLTAAGTDTRALAAVTAQFDQTLQKLRASSAVAAASVRQVSNSAAQAGGNMRTASNTVRDYGNQAAGAATKNRLLSNTFRELYGSSRQSMSLFQRFRGEILGLTASYVGLFGAIQGFQRSRQVFLDIEAVTSRLGVALNGNVREVERTMRFLRTEADRLGITFTTLAGEFSKFAVASRGTTLEGKATEEIFIAVAEAGRVFKLSNEQLEGTFLALTQMLSKGAVSMEELRRQLGDRLPGAFQIAARAMGLTTAELNELVASGNLASEEFLPKFAAELKKAVAPQLEASLNTLTTELGRMNNEFIRGGESIADRFAPALRDAAVSLTEFLQSSDGDALLEGFGSAISGILKLFVFFIENLDVIKGLLLTVFGARAAKVVLALGKDFSALGANIKAAQATLAGFSATSKASAASMVGLRGAASGLSTTVTASVPPWTALMAAITRARIALTGMVQGMTVAGVATRALAVSMGVLRTAIAALGGPIGILISVASFFLVDWLSSTEEVTDAMGEHKRQLDEVTRAYRDAESATDDWAASIENVTVGQAIQTMLDLITQYEEKVENLENLSIPTKMYKNASVETRALIRDAQSLTNQFKNGEINAVQYADGMNQIAKDIDPADRGLRRIIVSAAQTATELKKNAVAAGEAGRVVEVMGGQVAEADRIYLSFGGTLQEILNPTEQIIDRLGQVAGIMGKLRALVPTLAMKDQFEASVSAIDAMVESARKLVDFTDAEEAAAFADVVRVAEQGKKNLEDEYQAKLKISKVDKEANADRKRREQLEKDFHEQSKQTLADLEQQRSVVGLTTRLTEVSNIIYEEQNRLKQAGLETDKAAIKAMNEVIVARIKTRDLINEEAEALEPVKKAEEELARIVQRRADALQLMQFAEQAGDNNVAEVARQQYLALSEQATLAAEAAIAAWTAIGGPEGEAAVASLKARIAGIKAETGALNTTFKLTARQINESLASMGTEGLSNFTDALLGGQDAFKSLGDAARTFFVDFIKMIGEAIIQALLLKAIGGPGGAGGAGSGIMGSIGNIFPGIFHGGGIAGNPSVTRGVNPSVFAGARRLHTGGLASGEVPAILESDEEVLTADDPRHMANGGGRRGGGDVKIINMIDSGSVVSEGNNTPAGTRSIMNVIKANRASVRQALGV